MKKTLPVIPVIFLFIVTSCDFHLGIPDEGPKTADHTVVNVLMNGELPVNAIQRAKDRLHIAYGHTSHGSQIIDGMNGFVDFADGTGCEGAYSAYPGLFSLINGGTGGTLDLADTPFAGAEDLGNPDYTSWADATRAYLNDPANSDINIIIWSWCGEADTSYENIDIYLNLMNELEHDYPGVTFVYMTGHLVGSGPDGNLNQRNNQIREFCRRYNKWLFDFADIESYDPDGNYYMDLFADDGCVYDAGGNGQSDHLYIDDGINEPYYSETLPASGDRNWALDWQDDHTENADWYDCGAAHSVSLNANMKAYAAWWLWCRLAGWNYNP